MKKATQKKTVNKSDPRKDNSKTEIDLARGRLDLSGMPFKEKLTILLLVMVFLLVVNLLIRNSTFLSASLISRIAIGLFSKARPP
jgi:hypothetical protein